MADLIDSYSESNYSTAIALYNTGSFTAIGQAITLSEAVAITSVKFYVRRGSATGTVTAKIYASTGTVGTNAKPTGDALATSDAVDCTDISTDLELYEWSFSPAYAASAGDLVVLLDGTNVATSAMYVGSDSTSPSHYGNAINRIDSTWNPVLTSDRPFYIYGLSDVDVNVSVVPLTLTLEPGVPMVAPTVYNQSLDLLLKSPVSKSVYFQSVGMNKVGYTGLTATSFTGCTGSVNHKDRMYVRGDPEVRRGCPKCGALNYDK